jgi:hypothetical protein
MRLKPLQFNTGCTFHRPYQNDVSTLRHFLLANQGFSFSYIEEELRREFSIGGTIDNIKKLQHSVYRESMETRILEHLSLVRRQCPECAVQLYHSDLFHIHWLSKCPIHHCKITELCPACNQPWPKTKELPKRHCSVCGIVEFDLLTLSIEINPDTSSYDSLSPLIEFINSGRASTYYLQSQSSLRDYCWWYDISIDHRLFTACQLERLNNITKKDLDMLGISIAPINKKEIPLKKEYDPTSSSKKENNDVRLQFSYETQLRDQYEVLKHLLITFFSSAKKSNPIIIASYRHLRMKDLIKGPPPCPLCMALSIWFFHTTIWDDEDKNHVGAGSYPFIAELNYDEFHTPFRCTKISNDSNELQVLPSFTSWTYKRSLELSFIDIYTLVKFVCERRRYFQNHEYHSYLNDSYDSDKRSFDDSNYLINYDGNHATIYYENEHPIDNINCHGLGHSAKTCLGYHEYLQLIMEEMIQFKFTINPVNFEYNNFLNLHSTFEKFSRLPYFKYTSGSSPIRNL